MPELPERKIEELLRAYAAKRRQEAGPPLQLHPVNRRLLLEEAARCWGQRADRAAPRQAWWRAVLAAWPRLAMAAAAVAVVGLATWAVVRSSAPGPKELRLAAQPAQPPAEAWPVVDRTQRLTAQAAAPGTPALARVEPQTAAGPPRVSLADATAQPVVVKAEPAVAKPTEPAPATAGTAPSLATPAPSQGQQPEQTPADIAARPVARAPGPQASIPATVAAARLHRAEAGPTPGAEAKGAGLAAVTDLPSTLVTATDRGMVQDAALPPASAQQRDTEPAAEDALALSVQPPTAPTVGTLASLLPEGRRLRFVRNETDAAPVTRARQTDVTLLATFELERQGTQIRLFDQDGSVYQGQVAEGPADTHRKLARSAPTETQSPKALRLELEAASGPPGAAASLTFRLTGTNLTLRQPVTLVGRLSAAPEPSPGSLPGATGTEPDAWRQQQTLRSESRGLAAAPAPPAARARSAAEALTVGLEGTLWAGTNPVSIRALSATSR